MLEKYFFLILLFAVNLEDAKHKEAIITMDRINYQLDEKGEIDVWKHYYKKSILYLKKKEGKEWYVKDPYMNDSFFINVSKSQIELKDEQNSKISFDWVDLNEFRLNINDTIFDNRTNSPLFEINHFSEKKVVDIAVLDSSRVLSLKNVRIHY
ncbi:hypothetical protein GUA46_01370 [Muricauda sp. HICW]|uniref:Uncharacterized protein n=1 Tax=Flagellimonas chongwuensis TaxID=2697365 RepID=A0A850NEV3_9FLAO|nr:hypothetical protein [Allomuricauda chongwuensis]NVN16975.1 hypothetical protein [Allomuricauda chongwuensis]